MATGEPTNERMPEKRRRTGGRPDSPGAPVGPARPAGGAQSPAERLASPSARAATNPPDDVRASDDPVRRARSTSEMNPRRRTSRTLSGPGRDPDNDRSLRALVSLRGTAVTSELAMRAREVGTPTAADMDAAERDVVVARRHYVPPEPLPKGRRTGRPTA